MIQIIDLLFQTCKKVIIDLYLYRLYVHKVSYYYVLVDPLKIFVFVGIAKISYPVKKQKRKKGNGLVYDQDHSQIKLQLTPINPATVGPKNWPEYRGGCISGYIFCIKHRLSFRTFQQNLASIARWLELRGLE